MKKLFNQVTENRYEEARITAKRLQEQMVKYFATRGADCSNIYKFFDDFDYMLRTYSNSKHKTQSLYNQLGVISKLSASDTAVGKLRYLKEDIRFYFLRDPKENMEAILSCFDEIADLNEDMEKIGGVQYNFYNRVMDDIGRCESALSKLKGRPSDTVMKELSEKFGLLFSDINRTISPPVLVEADEEQIYQMHEQGVSKKDLADGLGQSEEELTQLLQEVEIKHKKQEAEEG
jgi:vacuolar-type H+-ATPase subunit I/STV1